MFVLGVAAQEAVTRASPNRAYRAPVTDGGVGEVKWAEAVGASEGGFPHWSLPFSAKDHERLPPFLRGL